MPVYNDPNNSVRFAANFPGNPMIAMQQEQKKGWMYTLLLKVDRSHFSIMNREDWAYEDRLALDDLYRHGWACMDEEEGCWALTNLGKQQLDLLQAWAEKQRLKTGSQYGSVAVPNDPDKESKVPEHTPHTEYREMLKFIAALRMRLQDKTSWGRNELYAMMNELQDAIVEAEDH